MKYHLLKIRRKAQGAAAVSVLELHILDAPATVFENEVDLRTVRVLSGPQGYADPCEGLEALRRILKQSHANEIAPFRFFVLREDRVPGRASYDLKPERRKRR